MRRGWSIPVLLLALVLSACNVTSVLPAPLEVPTPRNEAPGHSTDTEDDGITLEEAAEVPVLAPAQITVQVSGQGVTVAWEGTGASLSHYDVMRKPSGAGAWEQVASVPARTRNVGAYQWQARSSDAVSYDYGVAAVDTKGMRSEVTPGPNHK